MSAIISRCGLYRYRLTRNMSKKFPNDWCLPWVMLNPSIADASEDDPTIRRIMEFSRRWGYGSVKVINLFAYRATNPKELKWTLQNIVGPENDSWLHETMKTATDVMVAWGNNAPSGQVVHFMGIVRQYPDVRLLCLDINKSGSPKHPLYVKGEVLRKIWRPL